MQHSKDEKLEATFLICPYCNRLLYRSKEDKKNYLRQKDQERSIRSIYQNTFKQVTKGKHEIKVFEEVK